MAFAAFSLCMIGFIFSFIAVTSFRGYDDALAARELKRDVVRETRPTVRRALESKNSAGSVDFSEYWQRHVEA